MNRAKDVAISMTTIFLLKTNRVTNITRRKLDDWKNISIKRVI